MEQVADRIGSGQDWDDDLLIIANDAQVVLAGVQFDDAEIGRNWPINGVILQSRRRIAAKVQTNLVTVH